jgi:peptidoglycan/xylan/chitin deacetylase (PgdA/CDA1 family)
MNRRDVFRTFAVAGAVVATGRRARAQRVEGGASGAFPEWPFEEIRVPYRERFGKIRWPNNGPLCVHVYVTSEWSWNRPLADADAKYKRDLSLESEQDQYTFTVGVWRAVRLLDKFDIKASIFPNAGMVERYPDLFRELQSKGHEIVARSYDQGTPTTHLTPEEERKEIQRATSIIQKVVGARPVGWINPGAKCTDRTPDILADEGYIWHGDLKGDDLPYGIKTRNGKKIVVIPHRTMTSNDFAVFPEGGSLKGMRGAKEATAFVNDLFDEYYRLGKEEYPGALTYGIHPMRSCIPDRIGVHERVFEHMRKFKDVWFARYVDMAEHWMKNYMATS